ncbi:Cardioactive peptide precursor, putative [Pediculus humanus corporis]|uniref:Cardioactive peptide, putative n=1 Tax=Pediculus humanus subsp. corporis TaxID=121224 RepID=E0VG48_PEDHC|nr:Cardioactive peptide precursor, putative [Pediculus humanus corporis]EEB12354.1 Cardioactive peptide precursor, putative [Pediculus humanus corporis]
MNPVQIHFFPVYSFAFIYLITLTFVTGDDVILQKRSERNRLDMDRFMYDGHAMKRPFCNAFTGCGKKRSEGSIGNILGFNTEPESDELLKQFLTEAKLWETIQEAKMELERRRQGRQNAVRDDVPLRLPLASYRRKRSTKKAQENNFDENINIEIHSCKILGFVNK